MKKRYTPQQALAIYRDAYLSTTQFAPRTRREYLTDLQQLCAYLMASSVRWVQAVTRSDLQGFLGYLDRQSMSVSTRRRKASAMRSFFRFLTDTGCMLHDPTEELVPPDVDDRAPRYLTVGEYERLRYAVRHDPRDTAIIELLLQGLRLSELAGLRLEDLFLAPETTSKARVGGKRHRRIIRLHTKACQALTAYLGVRTPEAQDERVFQTKYCRGMGPRSIEDVVTKHLRAAGIEDASLSCFRHTYAVHGLARGAELEAVQDVLGHADLRSMRVYVDLAREEMDRQLRENAL
jgi:site-specific recombinase XerD